MKSERVTLLTTPEFKAFLTREAEREGVSVAELVRGRCERRPLQEDHTLAALTLELRDAVRSAKASLRDGLARADEVLAELQASRVSPAVRPRSTRRARASA